MTSIWTIQFQSLPFQPSIWGSKNHIPSYVVELRPEVSSSYGRLNWTRRLSLSQMFVLRAIDGSASSGCEDQTSQDQTVKSEADTMIIQDPVRKLQGMISFQDSVRKLQGMISSFPPIVFGMRQRMGSNFAIGICIATAFLVMAVRVYMVRKSRYSRPGSVADLVRRGQLRSDRRGISRPLKYDDPFDNPLVKVGKNNSTVEMCGKVYRLAPVTLTEKEQAIHQKRRSRAYQWKRPTIFLKEGDSIPPDVDPDTVRWIPANHPFATTASDIDEDLAQNNVYQKHGVPFRIQAEHDALQRKLESLHSDQKLNKLVIDPGNAKDFERAFKSYSKPIERGEENFLNDHASSSKPPLSESEEMQKP